MLKKKKKKKKKKNHYQTVLSTERRGQDCSLHNMEPGKKDKGGKPTDAKHHLPN